ncbi:MAG: hypothetical protein ACYDA2_10585 [Acidimicrobiales bacterium]
MTEQIPPPPPDPGVAVVGATRPTRVPAPPAEPRRAAADGNGGGRRGRLSRPVWPAPAGGRRWLVPVLALYAVVMTVLTIGFAVAWSNLSSQNDSRATMVTVARDFVLALTNFKPNTVDSDFRAISSYATGQFAQQSNQFFGSSIRQQLEAAQAQSQGQIRYAYVQDFSGDQGKVYVEVDQTYANNRVTTPTTDVLQVVLDLTDTSGGWKISAVTVLNPPSSAKAPTGTPNSATGGH